MQADHIITTSQRTLRLIACALFAAALLPVQAAHAAQSTAPLHPKARLMQITLRVGNDVAHAELEDTAATREFVAMLPLTAKFEDFASAEKISYLPRKLNVAGAGPAGPAQRWDLMYYVPWGNLAVFYRAYSPSPDLLRLGRIVSGTDVLTRTSSFTATIERVED